MVTTALRPRSQHSQRPLPSVPTDFTGSDAEYYVFVGLLRHGLREGTDFKYSPRPSLSTVNRGDFIPDFELHKLRIIIQVQSAYFHSKTATQRAVDYITARSLESKGFRVRYISESQARADAYFYVGQALTGETDGPIGVLV